LSVPGIRELGCGSVEEFQDRCINDLFYLCSVVLRHGKKTEYRDLSGIHLQFCDYLSFSTNPYPQKLTLMSRDSLKSTLGRGMTIQEGLKALKYGEESLLAIYTGITELSEDHLQLIEREILTNELIQAYFQGIVPIGRNDCDTCEKDKFRFRGFGIDIGSPKKALSGKHYRGMWTDNLMNEVNSRTADMRRVTFISWQQAESLLRKDAWEVVTETPWEKDDVSGRILDPKCRFDYRRLKGKSPGRFMSVTGYDVFTCPSRNEKGELNFPGVQDEQYLERKKRKQGTYIYMRMYDLQVVSDEDIRIDPRMIIHWATLPANFIRFMNIDCAGTKARESSHSAMTITDWGEDRILYVDYAAKRKIKSPVLYDWVIEEYDRAAEEGRPVDMVLIEREKYGIFLADLLELNRPDIRVLSVNLKSLPRPVRHMTVVPYFERGHIQSRKGLRDYEDEVTEWYRGKEEDVDIFDTLYLAVANQMIPQKIPEVQHPPGYTEAARNPDFEEQVKRGLPRTPEALKKVAQAMF